MRIPRAPSQGLAMSLETRRLQFYFVLVLADMALLLGCFALAAAVYPNIFSQREAMLPAYLILPLFQTIAFYNGTYSRDGLTNWRGAAWRAGLALAVSALMFNFFAFFAKANAEFSRVVFVAGLVSAAAGMAVVRWVLARFIIAHWGPSATNRLLIDAGGPPVAIPNLYRVNAREHGLRPDLDDPLALDRLSKYLRNMDMVIVSCGPEDRLAWSEVLRGSGIHGEVISDFAHEIGALAIVRHKEADVTALVVSRGHLGLRARITKRAFDLVLTSIALIVLAPLMLACAAAIKLDSPGPVFFRQRRMGRGNQFFDIYKFRSMRHERADSAGRRSAAKDDDRVTRVGRILRRTSIDELPQLLNVLLGDMSPVHARLPLAQPDPAVFRGPDGGPAGHAADAEGRMMGRLLWTVGLVVLALVTCVAQVDRASRFAPPLAPYVPQAFRGFAQAQLVTLAMAGGDTGGAVQAARRLVRVRPMPAENLTALAQAALLAQDAPLGIAALEEAGRRGWREPFSQLVTAQAALQTGNAEAASQRVVALLASGAAPRAQVEPLAQALVALPDGREALARRLVDGGHWRRTFLAGGHAYLGAEAFADVVALAAEQGADLDCRSLATAARALHRSGEAAAADRFWPGRCPARRG